MPSIRISWEYSWPAVDRSFEGVTGRPRQAVENELLDLPLSIAHYNRPALVLFGGDVPADLGGAGVERLGVGVYHDLFGDSAHFQLDVGSLRLRHPEHDILRRCSAESGGRDAKVVRAGRQIRQRVRARTGGRRVGFDAGRGIGRDDSRAWHYGTSRIRNRPIQRTDGALAEREAGQTEKKQNKT